MSIIITDAYWRRVRLKSIVDGNTVRLLVDLGFRIYSEHSIRLNGVNTTKIYRVTTEERTKGLEALNFVDRWFENHYKCARDKSWPFLLHSLSSESFGRYLGEVYCQYSHFLNDELLNSGYARPFRKEE